MGKVYVVYANIRYDGKAERKTLAAFDMLSDAQRFASCIGDFSSAVGNCCADVKVECEVGIDEVEYFM